MFLGKRFADLEIRRVAMSESEEPPSAARPSPRLRFWLAFGVACLASVAFGYRALRWRRERIERETPTAHLSAPPPRSRFTLKWPERPRDAANGSTFTAEIRDMGGSARQRRIAEEILRGNVPGFLRVLVPVVLRVKANHRWEAAQLTIWVTPDYLSVGSDDDFLRVPINGPTAQRIADELDAVLPTPKIVDAIEAQAEQHVSAIPLPPDEFMMTTPVVAHHNELIEQAMAERGYRHGPLTAGHKKDVVISAALEFHRDRLAIYGFYDKQRQPIQDIGTTHEATFADYAQGVRLIADPCVLNGAIRSMREVLADPGLARLVSTEGPLRVTRYGPPLAEPR